MSYSTINSYLLIDGLTHKMPLVAELALDVELFVDLARGSGMDVLGRVENVLRALHACAEAQPVLLTELMLAIGRYPPLGCTEVQDTLPARLRRLVLFDFVPPTEPLLFRVGRYQRLEDDLIQIMEIWRHRQHGGAPLTNEEVAPLTSWLESLVTAVTEGVDLFCFFATRLAKYARRHQQLETRMPTLWPRVLAKHHRLYES